MADTITKKKFNSVKAPSAGSMAPRKGINYPNHPGKYEGQLSKNRQSFAEPMNGGSGVVAPISSIGGLHNDIGEQSGFITDGYIDKGGTPYGEDAKFNFLPPGMDISNQENAEIHDMPMRKLTHESYPGDGWMPAPRDLPE